MLFVPLSHMMETLCGAARRGGPASYSAVMSETRPSLLAFGATIVRKWVTM